MWPALLALVFGGCFVGEAAAADIALLRTGECWNDQGSCEVVLAVGDGGVPSVGAEVVLEQAVVGSVANKGRLTTEILHSMGSAGPGLSRFEVRPGVPLVARVGDQAGVALPAVLAEPRPAPSIVLDVPRELRVGEVVEITIGVPVGVGPEDVIVATSEGRAEVRADASGTLVARIVLAPDRSARVLGLGVLDRRSPGAAPVWEAVPLRARQTADVQIGAGNRADVQVGSRRYGPFYADASGEARLVFDVLPGEGTAQITATDDLNNRRTVQTPLPTRLSSVVALLAWPLVGDRGVGLRTHVWDAAGRDAPDVVPICVGPDGVLALSPRSGADMEGRWERHDQGFAEGDVGVDCAAGLASARVQVALGAGQPDHIELRVYPESLASDFPLAQVQANLVDRRGQPMAPNGLTVAAARGSLTVVVQDRVLRAEYRGEDAVLAGGDELRATWHGPPGRGPAWELTLSASQEAGAPVAQARVRDRAGNPLSGVVVTFSSGGQERTAVSDTAGWARVVLDPAPGGLVVVSARTGSLRTDASVFAGAAIPLPDAALPDLAATTVLPIRAGKVRRIYLDVSPRPLPLDGARPARVRVQLLDAAGNLVRGESAKLEADLGSFGPTRALPDGTIEADWAPPVGTTARQARITASVGDTSSATDLELVPRAARGSVGASAGWITNFNAVSSPAIGVSFTTKIPRLPPVVEARIGVSAWGVSEPVHDDQTGETIDIRAQFLALDVGPVLVERQATRVLEGGVSLVVMPYALTVDYGDDVGVVRGAVAPPGILLHAAPGLRFGNAEVLVETRYLFAPAGEGAVAFAGGAGGLSLSLRYRLLF